jgi:hypothetical protein
MSCNSNPWGTIGWKEHEVPRPEATTKSQRGGNERRCPDDIMVNNARQEECVPYPLTRALVYWATRVMGTGRT